MRFGMLSIWLLVLGLVVTGSLALGRIGDAERALRQQALPGLIQAEHLVTNVADLAGLLNGIEELQTLAELDDTKSKVDALLLLLHAQNEKTLEIQRLLNLLEDSAISTLSGSGDVLRQRRVLSDLLDGLMSEMKSGMDLAVDERDHAGARFEAVLQQSNPRVGTSLAGANLQEGLHELNTLTRIADGFEKISEYGALVAEAHDHTLLDASASRLGFQVRRITSLIASLPPSEARVRLASVLQSIHAPLFGENGAIDARRLLIDTQIKLRAERREQERLIRSVSDEAATILGNARAGIIAATDTTSVQVESFGQSLRISGAVSLLLLVVIAALIVERQIIRRLARLKSAVIQIADGNDERVVGVTGDDELGQMARSLEVFKSNARELRRSNSELARFAYAASHDLRAPLRAIRDLTEWTIEDGGKQMPEGCHQNLTMILQRVDRLSKLLGNLLDYSRVGREEASLTEMNVESVSRELVDLLSPNGAFDVITIAADPYIVTHVTPLTQVLLNLFSNAVKHHDRPQGVITVEVQREGNRAIFSVTDDGPGVAPQYHDQIFELFKTLRARDDVEGSGMGLAIIRKLVEKHGGSVHVISDPDLARGTTFRFDWPIAPQSDSNAIAA